MSILPKISARLAGGSLARRSLSSSFWSMLELGSGHGLRLVGNLVMTRLLAPEAFGLMAMVTTIYIGVQMLSDLGIRQSIIRSADAGETYLRTAWTVQALRGTAMACVILLVGAGLWLLGPRLAVEGTVYADPLLPALIAVFALTVQTEALVSVNMHLAARHMELSRIALMNVAAQCLSIATMIGVALHWPSVWALLLGGMVSAAFRAGVSHVIFRGPPMRPAWDPVVRGELWHFGKWLIGSSALSFVARNTDRLILGALIPATPFGLYVIALLWVQAYTTAANLLTGQVGLPFLSSIRRERPADLPRLFRRFMLVLDLFCLLGFLFFLFAGDVLIGLLYTEDYAAAGQFMPLLAVLILTQRFMIFIELMIAEGESFLLMLTNGLSGVVVCLAVPLAYVFFGVSGAIAASILSSLAAAAAQLAWSRRILGRGVLVDWLWLVAIVVVTGVVLAVTELPDGG